MALVETAGGVCSPAPSGSLQADALQRLRLPAILVADCKLGGISTTLSAYESLLLRGYDVAAVVGLTAGDSRTSKRNSLENIAPVTDTLAHLSAELTPSGFGDSVASAKLDNLQMIAKQLAHGPGQAAPAVFALPPCPPPASGTPVDTQIDAELQQWLQEAMPQAEALRAHLAQWHARRVARLQELAGLARTTVWWPFTQHATLAADEVTVIDARAGESFSAFRGAPELAPSRDTSDAAAGSQSIRSQPQSQLDPSSADAATSLSAAAAASATAGGVAAVPPPQLNRLYDACASWWTQGLSAELAPRVRQHLAYAAGRYGHVIFPEAAHEPAVRLSELLLSTVGRGWATRAFYSDDGSTAVEVALKMAFRTFALRRGHDTISAPPRPVHVLGLQNGYHGDTLGTMDCAEESVFNAGQTPWYQPRGLFLEPPTCGLEQGVWQVRPPAGACPATERESFDSRDALFSDARLDTPLASHYDATIVAAVAAHQSSHGVDLGACLIEPVMQGAGGMVFVDPLFQKVMVSVCRRYGIPVIADEVFTGLWRLGHASAMGALGLKPDVACFAKLLTAGMVPMSVTLATDEVFNAFEGDEKAQALLHGHSYTAHPIGCQAGIAAFEALGPLNPNMQPDKTLAPLWSAQRVSALSHHQAVERVVSLGCVLAVELKVIDGAGGYASGVARTVTSRMRKQGVYARPLGNVVYLMVTPTSSTDTTERLLDVLEACL